MFGKFVSNTLAANGNQTVFFPDGEGPETGVVFLKVFAGGAYDYIFAYSDTLDSTFADGSASACNDVCPPWRILSLSAAATSSLSVRDADFTPVLFGGREETTVGSPTVLSDPVRLDVPEDGYLCLKLTFAGEKLPYHEESIMPVFRLTEDGLQPDKKVPLPVFTGVRRSVNKRVGFLGDSITQGCGTPVNGYGYYAAYLSALLGKENAYQDLGLGYARASDAATDGIWLRKAKQNDVVTVCFGVNDILQGHPEETVKADLKTIVEKLKEAGCTVILQTVPPFDYGETHEKIWRNVNGYIRGELSRIADAVFDDVPVLSADGKDCPQSKYGAHPSAEGHKVWAEALRDTVGKFL